jgi:membrane protease YdiL (CAAX protease family)
MTLILAIPLLAANEPPLLWFFKPESGAKLADSMNSIGATLYGLIWAVPASFIAVGFPIKRTLREAQQRLALVWPSRFQFVVAIAIALVLALAVGPAEFLINTVWKFLGLRLTDTAALEELFKFAINPVGAIIVGISAGLGEELVFRGVLQPRLGIVLPALMFTSLHAFQYDFDALLWVLLLGLLMGIVRRKTNTTTCVVIHATYDVALFLSAYLFGTK